MFVFSAKLKKLKKDKVIENGDEDDEVSQELLTPFCSNLIFHTGWYNAVCMAIISASP